MKKDGKVGLIKMLLRMKLYLMDIMIHLIPFASFYSSGEHLQKFGNNIHGCITCLSLSICYYNNNIILISGRHEIQFNSLT